MPKNIPMIKLVSISIAIICFQQVPAQTNRQKDISAIGVARKASNEAIARHDIEGTAKYWWDEFISIGGNGGSTIGRDSAMARYKRQFENTPGLTYIRTPKNIIISDADTLAFETGKWVGLQTKEVHPEWIGGNYSAMWWKRAGTWKLRSELFVSLQHY